MDLHGKIMNLPADGAMLDWANTREAYLYGHRDARHAAAKIALNADACIDALRAIVEQQRTMGFDGSPSDELMQQARAALAALAWHWCLANVRANRTACQGRSGG